MVCYIQYTLWVNRWVLRVPARLKCFRWTWTWRLFIFYDTFIVLITIHNQILNKTLRNWWQMHASSPASTHHSDGIKSHLSGGWRRERLAPPLPPPPTAQMGPPHIWGGPICTVCRDQFPRRYKPWPVAPPSQSPPIHNGDLGLG